MLSNIKSALGSKSYEEIPAIHVSASNIPSACPVPNINALKIKNSDTEMIQICNDHYKATLFGTHYEKIYTHTIQIRVNSISQLILTNQSNADSMKFHNIPPTSSGNQ